MDAVIAAGGDGTYLRAASLLHSPAVPLLGLNTDSARSKGQLCSAVLEKDGAGFGNLLHRLRTGEFRVQMRGRLKVRAAAMAVGQRCQARR